MPGEMMEGAPQQAPQGGPQQGGDGAAVMQEVGATLMGQAESLKQFAGQMAQIGAPESAAVKLDQAATLIQQATSEMGIGEAPQEAPQAGGDNPDTAGVAGARPAEGF